MDHRNKPAGRCLANLGYPFCDIPEESILVVVGHGLAVFAWLVVGFQLWVTRKDKPQDGLPVLH
jgi:hypothetical protein